jgi:uncharacterized protein (UPF0248 family)
MYTPLYIKTDYSLLNSLIKIDDLIKKLKKLNITSCAICDDNLYGTMEFINKMNKNNIKAIIGLDIILDANHILLYAENEIGYHNLVRIENIKNDREKNTKEYQEIVELLRGKLAYTDEGKEKVYVPYVAFVVNGKVIDYDSETSDIKEDITPEQYWNREQKERLQVKLGTLMELVNKGSICTDCNK